LLVTFICASAVFISDKAGIFRQNGYSYYDLAALDDYRVIQQLWVWDGFYDFIKSNPLDIILFGNSHSNMNLNAINLSLSSGTYCYNLGFGNTTLTDVYFTMKEAFEIQRPKLAVVETFCIYCVDNYSSHNLSNTSILAQLFSFEQRRNFRQKLLSLPILFSSDNYLAALSNTIRNHSFIFQNSEQIQKNIDKKNEYKKYSELRNEYFFGQLQEPFSVLNQEIIDRRYGSDFNKIDASSIIISDEAKEYIEKIAKLCKDNKIPVIFVTTPCYPKIVDNWEIFHSKLNAELNKYDIPYLDLQANCDTNLFTPQAFQNVYTIGIWQHLSPYGSNVATNFLSEYLHNNYPNIINRNDEINFQNIFYNFYEYFYYHSVSDNDLINKGFYKNKNGGNYLVKEVDFIVGQGSDFNFTNRTDGNRIILKIAGNKDVTTKKINVLVAATYQNQKINTWIEMEYLPQYFGLNHYVFQCQLNKEVQIDDVLDVQIN
jgi:hypothetical protein